MYGDTAVFGWEFPAGVRVTDIPGNRPQDVAEEKLWEQLDMEDVCTCNREHCDHAIWAADEVTWQRCNVDAWGQTPYRDPAACPHAHKRIELELELDTL